TSDTLSSFLGAVRIALRHGPDAVAFLALVIVGWSHTRAFEAEDPVGLTMRAVPRGHVLMLPMMGLDGGVQRVHSLAEQGHLGSGDQDDNSIQQHKSISPWPISLAANRLNFAFSWHHSRADARRKSNE